MTKILLDGIFAAVASSQDSFAEPDWLQLLSPVGLMVLVWGVGYASQSLSIHLRMILSISSNNYAQELILRKAASMDLAFYETPAFHDRLHNAVNETHRVHSITFSLFHVLGLLISLVALLGLLATSLHPFAIPVLLVTTIPQAVALGHYVKKRHRVWADRTRLRRLSRYLSQLLVSRDAVKEIRLFGLHLPFVARYAEACRVFLVDERDYRYSLVRVETVFNLLSLAGTASLWGYAVIRAVGGFITMGDVIVVLQAAEQARTAVSTVFDRVVRIYENRLYADSLVAFLDLEPDSVAGALAPPVHTPRPVPSPLRKGIEFRGVCFCYPGMDDVPVLRDLSFVVPAGHSVALVGQNGAGKTTLVKLLSRLYDPTSGTILLDGVDLRQYDLTDWRSQVSATFQDFVRYELTARENIGFGRVEHVNDTARVSRAAEQAGAMAVIDGLANGLETSLGRTYDDGTDLSGGQWQLLALGRGYMRDAQVLILDEPTAALDAIAEQKVYQRFAELTAGRTTILISHRFSTVRMADHILVLDQGALIEEGTHESLLADDGLYARMYNAQAERYR